MTHFSNLSFWCVLSHWTLNHNQNRKRSICMAFYLHELLKYGWSGLVRQEKSKNEQEMDSWTDSNWIFKCAFLMEWTIMGSFSFMYFFEVFSHHIFSFYEYFTFAALEEFFPSWTFQMWVFASWMTLKSWLNIIQTL